jgi:CheY-like chemotaxis protein
MSWALLIVEDDADICSELDSIFTARGFHAFVASNGVEALDLARQRGIKPSVILLDLLMPVMNGLEFLEQQHEVPLLADVPVVVLTAQRQLMAHGLPPTVRAVLDKPTPLATLIQIIQDVCGHIPRSGMPPPTFAKGTGALDAAELIPPGSAPPLRLDHVEEGTEHPGVDRPVGDDES